MLFPDYEHSTLGIPAAVEAHFGGTPPHAPLARVTEALAGCRAVGLLVLDGLGLSSLLRHTEKDGFLQSRLLDTLSAVFPPTTTAATTTLRSGLSPAEHGWLGWRLFFEETSANVDIFPNKLSYVGRPAPYRMADTHLAYDSLSDRLNRLDAVTATETITSYDPDPCKTFEEIGDRLIAFLSGHGCRYAYAYWPQPDERMHKEGVDAPRIHTLIRDLERSLAVLERRLPTDAALLVTADHGLVDATYSYLEDAPDLVACLAREPSIENRALGVLCKEGCKERFAALFLARFGQKYRLFTAEEALHGGLFGPGTPHPRTRGFLGDFIAVSLAEDCLALNRAQRDDWFKAMHAGLTEAEMQVPLLLLRR